MDIESKKDSAESQKLVKRLLTDDPEAAAEIFRRYLRRLTALARARLSRKVGRRVDPEDAVQSAFRSFFIGARSGRFSIEQSEDLWRLLATITARKVSRLTLRHHSHKRAVDLEVCDGEPSPADFLRDRLPLPAEAAAIADELTTLMQALPGNRRRALQLRLEDTPIEMIAGDLDCTERTVRRWLHDIQKQLEQRFFEGYGVVFKRHVQIPTEESGEGEAKHPPRLTTPAPFVDGLPTIDYRDLVIQSHLGTGGMGRVYRVWQRSTDRHLAVKVLKKGLQQSVVAVDRFVAETRLIATFNHPNIVRLHGLGRMPAGGYFFAMPLAEGGDLQQQIDAGPITLPLIKEWMRQTADALAHAHSRGIVHCDLKPSNLLIDRNGRIIVSDFGFAVALSARPQRLGGTPAYIAPELLDCDHLKVSERTDVWGIGAVLYAMLFGVPPIWNGENLDLTKFSHSPHLMKICRGCLQLNPGDRFSDVRQIRAALDESI